MCRPKGSRKASAAWRFPLILKCARANGPYRCADFESDSLDEAVTFRSHRAAPPAIGADLPSGSAVGDNLFELGDQERAPERRREGGYEQTMVAAGQRARHRPHGEAADAVSAEPFAQLSEARSPVASRPNRTTSTSQHCFSAHPARSVAAAVAGGSCGSFRFHPPPRDL